MIRWEVADTPDGPAGKTVIRSWIGYTPSGEKLYLSDIVSATELRERYATLGVLGRLPTEDEASEAKKVLGFPEATHSVPPGAFGVRIDVALGT